MMVDELKSLLSRFRIKPDKRLGQNFLLSQQALEQIVEAAHLTSQDSVLEIGPGLGALTRRLAEKAQEVIAIEKDKKMYAALRRLFKNQKNLKLIRDDALFFSPPEYGLRASGYKVVANIPYYLTGKLLQNFLTAEIKPSLLVLLLQKEVAERITAKAGEMSVLSVATQFYAKPEIIAFVPKQDFYPVPEVDSAIVKLTVYKETKFLVEEKQFFNLVKIGFSNKRKQLHNNLNNLPVILSPPAADEESQRLKEIATPPLADRNDKVKDYKKLLQDLGLNPLARAQDLGLEDWVRLYERVVE